LFEELGYRLFQRCDPPPLLGDERIFPLQLGLKLCDSIVSPVALHDAPHDRAAVRWKELSDLEPIPTDRQHATR
jgi:hypothetical protein